MEATGELYSGEDADEILHQVQQIRRGGTLPSLHRVVLQGSFPRFSGKEHCPEEYLEVQGIPKDPFPALPSFLQHQGKGEEGHCQDQT